MWQLLILQKDRDIILIIADAQQHIAYTAYLLLFELGFQPLLVLAVGFKVILHHIAVDYQIIQQKLALCRLL